MNRRVALLAIGLGLSAVGLGLALTGERWGIIALCVGILATIAGASWRFDKEGRDAVELAEIGDEDGLLFAVSPGKNGIGLACLVAAFGGCIALAADGNGVGAAGILVFGVLIVLGVRYLRAVDGIGLTPTRVVAGYHGELPWEAVVDADVLWTARMTSVRIIGRDSDLRFPSLTLAAEPEAIVAAVKLYLREPDRRSGIGTEPELERMHAQLR